MYSEWLVEHGARVTGIDASAKMIELAKQRLQGRAEIHEADLSRPLEFLEDGSFDLVVSPLVLDYVPDWRTVFAEFKRVLRPGGSFVFSVGHPVFEFLYFKTENYFLTERVGVEWNGFGDTRVFMPSIRRPLEEVLNPLIENGFRIDRILEPKVTKELAESDPEHFEKLSKRPCFLCVRSIKD